MAKKNISGFYYDIQRENKLLRVTLHANTKPPTNPYETWYAWTDNSIKIVENNEVIVDDKKINPEFPKELALCTEIEEDEPKTAQEASNDKKDTRYGKTPICTSILTEDFGISISNGWTDFEGGNQLQGLVNDVMKPIGPYASLLGKGLEKFSQGAANFSTENSGSSIGNFASKLAKWSAYGSKFANARGDILGRQLVVQGTRFKYWAGTSVDFGNLSMRFTLFADYVKEGDIYVWKTPDDQLASILPYALGKYVKLVDDKETDPIAIKLKEIVDDKLGTDDSGELNSEIANNFLGWQIPPAGFSPNIKDLDEIQSGTLMLKIGAYYKLKNLAIQNLQLNYSKQVAKYFNTNTYKLETCPLFCEVTLTLIPVTKYSDKKLREFVLNRSRTTYDLESEIVEGDGKELTDSKGQAVTEKVPQKGSNGEILKDSKGNVIYVDEPIKINTKSVKITKVSPKITTTTSIINLEKDINDSLGL